MIIENTLTVLFERWTDPGDYPSGAGGGPLPSYTYAAEIEGAYTVVLERGEPTDVDRFQDMATEAAPATVTAWDMTVEGPDAEGRRRYAFAVRDFDPNTVECGDEADAWDDGD